MAMILLIACSNFICISCGVQKTTEQAKVTLKKIDSIYTSSLSDNENKHKSMDVYINRIRETLCELDNLKKGIFDSNTITFLSSFVLVFLGGILFDIEKRAKDKLVKSERIIKRIVVELNQIKIAKQTNTISILSKYLQLQLSSSKYEINSDIINITNELNKSFQYLLTLLQDKKTEHITEDAQKEYISVLHDIKLLLEKEDIHTLDNNKDKLTYIYGSQKLLSECLNEIESMKNSGRIISG